MADYSLGTAHGTIQIDADTSGVDKTEEALKRVDKSAGNTGAALDRTSKGMAIAGGAIAGGLALATKTAADFEAQLSGIAAVGGAEAVASMDQIRAAALRIGADTSFSASEAAAAMEELVKAGIPVKDVLNGAADATVALAAATGVDMPTAASIASNAMNVFNLEASDLGGVVDNFAQTANASAIDVTDLGMAMQQVGAVAQLAGLSLEDTTSAIGQLGDAGIKGSDAGTSLKTMLSNLQPATLKQTTAMEELGLITEDGTNQFYDAQGSLKSLRDIQELLQNSTADLTDAQKQQYLETIFGSDAIRAAAVLADGGAESFDNFADKQKNAGTAAEQAAIRQDNLKGSLEQLKGSLENAAITVGSALIPVVRTLADGLRVVVDWFGSLDSGTQTTIVTVLAITASLLLLGAGLIKIVRFSQNLIATLKTLRIISTATSPGFIKMAAQGVASFAKMAASAIANAATVIASWAAAAARTLVEWARMAVAAAVNAVKVAASWVLTHGVAAATAIAQTTLAVARILAQWLIMGVQSLARAAMVALAWIVAMGPIGWAIALFLLVVAAVILFWDDIVGWFQQGAAWISSIMSGVWDWIKQVWDWIVNAFRVAGQWILDALTATWNWIKNIWDTIINFFRQIPGWIGGIFSSALNWLINAGRNILTGLWNGIKAIWNNVIGWIGGIGGWIIGKLAGAGSWLLDIGRRLIQGLWNGISNAFGWLWDKISGFFSRIWDGIKDFFGIGSPSKLFRDELGKQLMIGMSIGIDKNARHAIDSALEAAAGVTSVATVAVGGPDAFWDSTALSSGAVPPSPEVASYAASQGDSQTGTAPTYNFNTYNPVAERASDSEARRLRALSALGAF